MDLAGGGSSFQSDLDFCPDCGSVLPLPGTQEAVTCARCGFAIHVRDFEGKVVRTAVVDRRCARCGHEGMAYRTRQMRSADEGQTVFFTCTRCKFQEKEDS
uniref:DNA-directed RNA polymerase subunit n=1 Tax=Pipistrellus kuhlii TaxID=59472 RepID=A0A7J7R575_PIPKU|nr:hypothetical protein mPipKuh1_019456 [Pipistrellus kuhlii]